MPRRNAPGLGYEHTNTPAGLQDQRGRRRAVQRPNQGISAFLRAGQLARKDPLLLVDDHEGTVAEITVSVGIATPVGLTPFRFMR